ncbi:MAG: prepilin-type N-terminal cleavage/methylation domain-containing protein [Verrucomicrobiia bacterium]
MCACSKPAAICPAKPVPWNSPRGLRAFTLIEVMIAMTIFGLVMVAIYSSWSAILRGSKVGLNAAAEAQRTRMATRAIREALTSAQLYVENIRYYSFMADTSGDFAALSLVSRLPASFPGSGLFGDQVVRRVSFTVESGPSGQRQLVLRQVPLLEPPETAETPYTIILAPNVHQFSMEFWNTNTLEWDPEWPFTNQLPKLVRFALSVGPPNHRPSPDDVSVQTALVSSMAIPRVLQIPPVRRGFGNPPGAVPGGRR